TPSAPARRSSPGARRTGWRPMPGLSAAPPPVLPGGKNAPSNRSRPHAPPIQRWLEHLDGERALSPHTLRAYEGDLVGFLDFLGRDFLAKPIASIAPGEVDALAVRSFLASLTKRGLSRRSQGRALAAVRGFFRWAAREGIVPANPAQGIRTPKAPKTLPRHLRPGEIESLLEPPDATEPMGRRDRALL